MRILPGVVALVGLLLGAPSGLAQPYPSRPVTVIVPYAPGGNTDVVARLVLEHVSQTLGQRFVVENVSGAGGTTGSLRAARANPDGYTLLVGQMGTHGAAVALYPNLAYHPLTDFAHIGQLSDTPIGVLARKDFPASDLREFIAQLKAHPDKLNQGHAGAGSTSHVSCLLFKTLVGVQPVQVAYRGSGPALSDLIAGQFDFMCDQIPHAVPQVQAGSIKLFAIATPERSPALPHVPTTIEAGLPEFQASGWNAMFAPKGTPQTIVDRLADAVNQALDDPPTRKRLQEILEPACGSVSRGDGSRAAGGTGWGARGGRASQARSHGLAQ
jgi:tripartite-type tricarboxylate transporter receptor subunit TctC